MTMAINHAFAGIPVARYAEALAWYERLLGRPPDVIVHEREAMWQVRDAAWIYVVEDTKRAGNALVTMLVDDLDRHVAEFTARGIAAGAIETVPGKYRKMAIVDPEGNKVSFGEAPGG